MRAEMAYWVLRARFSKRWSASASTIRVATPYKVAPKVIAKVQPAAQNSTRDLIAFVLLLADLSMRRHFILSG